MAPNPHMKKSIRSTEWLLAISLLAVMASLVIVSKINVHRADSTLATEGKEAEMIAVTIEGAVAKPGSYSVPAGTPVETVLRKARPKPWANLQKISLRQIVEAPINIVVEELSEIKVTVKGAVVECEEIVLPARSRICDLKSKIHLSEEADKGFFRKRRALKQGEIIEVPKKTVEINSAN